MIFEYGSCFDRFLFLYYDASYVFYELNHFCLKASLFKRPYLEFIWTNKSLESENDLSSKHNLFKESSALNPHLSENKSHTER